MSWRDIVKGLTDKELDDLIRVQTCLLKIGNYKIYVGTDPTPVSQSYNWDKQINEAQGAINAAKREIIKRARR